MADCPPMNGFCRNQIPRLENYANGFLTVRSVKLFADGALGSWGAAMIEDYSDKPGSRGSMLLEYDQLEDLVRKVHIVILNMLIISGMMLDSNSMYMPSVISPIGTL